MDLPPMSQMQDNLFLGSYQDALLEGPNMDILISALSVPEYRTLEVEAAPHVEWHKLIVSDTEEEEIRHYFFQVHTIVRQGLREGKKILVHCAAGKSRSATIVIAHYMLENKWTRKQAFEHVSRHRLIVEPNEGFMDQLKSLEVWMHVCENSVPQEE